jgi:hypothetical protein
LFKFQVPLPALARIDELRAQVERGRSRRHSTAMASVFLCVAI